MLSGTPENINSALDERSFEVLFKKHFREMVFFAQRYVKDIDAARDITHDAFVALWLNRKSIDLSRPVNSWLATTIHNKCLNHLRDNKKFDQNMVTLEHLAQMTDRGHDQLVSEETTALIHRAIEELPEKCREVFMLSRFENLKYQEIADKLGISVKTVETQMSKALQHMRIRLKPYLLSLLFMLMSGGNF